MQQNWDRLCGTPWQMVALEVRLTKRELPQTEKEREPPLPRIAIERIPETKPRRFYVLFADIEAHGQTGDCPSVR